METLCLRPSVRVRFLFPEFRAPDSHSSRNRQIGANRFIRSASFAGGAFMLQNRQNQVANVQIAARRNLDQVALVVGLPRLHSISKRRLYWSMYGKRPTSSTQPQFGSGPDTDSQNHLGSGSDQLHCHRSRLRNSAGTSLRVTHRSERQCAVCSQVSTRVPQTGVSVVPTVAASKVETPAWRIPASAWAAFAIQSAIKG